MQAMEERYKKYIEKAKSVIKTLDPKQNPNAVPEVSALRKQLTEKDVLIEALEQVSQRILDIGRLIFLDSFTIRNIVDFLALNSTNQPNLHALNWRNPPG